LGNQRMDESIFS